MSTHKPPRLEKPEKSDKAQLSDDPKKTRTRAAIDANMRRREEKAADLLFERGWGIVSPYSDLTPSRAEAMEAMRARAIELLHGSGWQLVYSKAR